MSEPVHTSGLNVSRNGPAGIIAFDNPAERNALSAEVLEAVAAEVEKFSRDKTCRSLIFTGTGVTFAAGANLKHIANFTSEEARVFGKLGQSVFQRIREFKGETVAAVNGFCMGGALDLALSCNYRIASESATFAHPGVSLGIITGWGGTQLLPRLIGSKNAYKLLLTAQPVAADEALSIGLIDEIADKPLERAMKHVDNWHDTQINRRMGRI